MYLVRYLIAAVLASFALSTAATGPASAQGQLNIYCSVQVEWCQGIATNFQRETGITVNMPAGWRDIPAPNWFRFTT